MAAPLDTPVYLKARELLRIADGAGLEVKCLRGNLWITRDGDREDRIVGSGESIVLDRPGLSLVTAPLDPALLVVHSRARSLRGIRSGMRLECHGARSTPSLSCAAFAGWRMRDVSADRPARCRRPASLCPRTLAESRYNRFFGALYELPPAELDRVIHLDRKYELALLAEARVDGAPIVIGEARYALAPDRLEGEFALSVADDWRGKGLGTLLMADIESEPGASA